MRRSATIFLAAGLILLGSGLAAAHQPGSSQLGAAVHYPGAPHPVLDTNAAPWPMNYADEAAQSMGVHNGRVDFFSSQPDNRDKLAPSLTGGIDRSGAMIKLQWHPGE